MSIPTPNGPSATLPGPRRARVLLWPHRSRRQRIPGWHVVHVVSGQQLIQLAERLDAHRQTARVPRELSRGGQAFLLQIRPVLRPGQPLQVMASCPLPRGDLLPAVPDGRRRHQRLRGYGSLAPVLLSVSAPGNFGPPAAIGVRRLHNVNVSVWFYLLGLIPYVGVLQSLS